MNKNTGLLILSILASVACSKKDFQRIDSVQKASALSEHMSGGTSGSNGSVSGGQQTTDAPAQGGAGTKDGQNQGEGGGGATVDGRALIPPGAFGMDLTRVCSTSQSNNGKKSFVKAKDIKVTIVNQRGQTDRNQASPSDTVLCTASGKNLVVTDGNKISRLIIPSCSIPAGTDVHVTLENEKGESLMSNGGKAERVGSEKTQNTLLWDDNQKISNNEMCERNASPLVVDFRDHSEQQDPFFLSSVEDGVMFDILGFNSDPRPFAKKQISWFVDPRIMPIVLPNKLGKVSGINELFGDNTMGPDGTFAANGFKALAKFDGRSLRTNKLVAPADGYIDKNDEVFAKLRLWSDEDLDGVAKPSELYTLEEMGVETIDLNYDDSFYMRDQYNNEYKYKSVLQTTDGSLKVIFDIWFRL